MGGLLSVDASHCRDMGDFNFSPDSGEVNFGTEGAFDSTSKRTLVVDIPSLTVITCSPCSTGGISKLISKVNYTSLVIGIMLFVSILVAYFSGILGMAILFVSTSVGLFAGFMGVGKNHCMACLILPVILYFVL